MIVLIIAILGAAYPLSASEVNAVDDVKITCEKAIINDEILQLKVDYDEIGDNVEIAKDMVVATDGQFSNTLELSDVEVNSGTRVYKYDISKCDMNDSVYVQLPVLYNSIEIEQISVPISTTMKNRYSTSGAESGLDWFYVSDYTIEKYTENVYQLTVSIISKNDDMPRFPILKLDGEEIGGISCLELDENGSFYGGEFIYFVNIDSEDLLIQKLESATILVGQALKKLKW